MNTRTLPDDAAHQENVLPRWATPISTADERRLADKVAALAEAIRARASRRDQRGDPTPLIGPSSNYQQP